ncbi:tubulointerstitial nephritis antigen-like [Procambarus clarkii]|uniref:tubulointerstitial nephritis antigen-like n=1 Tax=Procambarus clarkii TaxID=6728 RepID=UPI001E675D70|nr:tubulointerstitial nephritis antigen-like [Procambarus clarkii]
MTQINRRPTGERGVPVTCHSLLVMAGIVAVVGVVLVPMVTAQFHSFADLPGDYCRIRRPTSCCDGRYDDCSLPIRGTLCYCDQFCNRTYNPDCCPDYWELCLGIRPSPPPEIFGCYKEGLYIPHGHSIKFNCNECKCQGKNLICEEDKCMIEEQVIQTVNLAQRQYGWRATNHSKFWGRKAREGLVLRTGTHNPEALSLKMYPILLRPDVSRIPRQFDARNKREWQGRVSGVSDQGWCGASWAFSTLGVTQDRLSIESLGNETVRLAPQHLLSCDRRGQSGCQGGHVDRAWQYLRRFGVVNEECYAYESGTTGQLPTCRVPPNANLFSLRCSNNEVVYQRRDLYKTEPAYRISGKETDIQWEILTNGPVQAIMRVQKDLFMYQSGVYSSTGLAGQETATHSVRIIGWGEDNFLGSFPVKYWLVANSWGTDWGERGFFRIVRGYNESDIETFVIAVRARLGSYARGGRTQDLRRPGGRSY